jgi:hypothetical protein
MKRGVGFVLVVLLAAVLLLGAFALWQVGQGASTARSTGHKTTWNGLTPPTTLAEAQSRARERAAQWATDLRLFKVEASWRPPADMLQVASPPVAWTFFYYAPSQSKFATVTVSGEKVLWVPPVDLASSPTALSTFPPAHGVESAWLSFRAAGGEDFLSAHADAMVQYRLQQTAEGVQWTVIAFGDGEVFEVVVDADTGLIRSKPAVSEQQ